MFRMNKLSDYGLVLLTQFVRKADRPQISAVELAAETRLPLPTVGKLLKTLTREGLLVSHRGARGGYSLARPARQITVTQAICALEGPIALTECTDHEGQCEYEVRCPTRSHLKRLNQIVLAAFDQVTLDDLADPEAAFFQSGPSIETLFPMSPVRGQLAPAGMGVTSESYR